MKSFALFVLALANVAISTATINDYNNYVNTDASLAGHSGCSEEHCPKLQRRSQASVSPLSRVATPTHTFSHQPEDDFRIKFSQVALNFSCPETDCGHYGECVNGACVCPVGFGDLDCLSSTCNSTQVLNSERIIKPVNSSCTCDEGFNGINCNVCSNDSVCARTDSEQICNKTPKVWKSHHMYCGVDEPLLESIYPGKSELVLERDFNTGKSLGAIYYKDEEQFYCQMTGCAQTLGDDSQYWNCDSIKCSCYPGSVFCGGNGTVIDLTQPISNVEGTFELKCPVSADSSCKFKISSLDLLFPEGLTLQNCMYGECARLSDEPADVLRTRGLTTVEITCIVIVSLILAASISLCLIAKRQQVYLRKLPVPASRTGASLQFTKISYVVKDKLVLKNLSGTAHKGQVMAIMGPSGAGKSTLLDILANKSKSGSIDGNVLVDGMQILHQKFKKMIGYVDQEDLLLAPLTVRETIMFSAQLRLPESIPYDQKVMLVESTMMQLGLSHIADSHIGGNGNRGISGGEKRRVSIAVELVTSPSIILLDEPTSGLDSYNAHLLVKSLASLAHEFGKTIIFTIHQPRSDVFQMFDNVYVLSKGECLYHGSAAEAVDFCESIQRPCPSGYNVADHLLDLAVETGYASVRTGKSIVDLVASETNLSLLGRAHSASIDSYIHRHPSISPTSNRINLQGAQSETSSVGQSSVALGTRSNSMLKSPQPHQSNNSLNSDEEKLHNACFYTQMTQLMSRSSKILLRKPSLLIAHLTIAIVLGLFVGGLYFKSDQSIGGVQNRLGSLFFILALIGFSSISAIGSFSEERFLFMRERSNGFYSPVPFFLTKVLFDTVFLRLIPVSLLGSISYWMILYSVDFTSFLKFFIVILIFAAECGLFCLCIAALFEDAGTANLVASIIMLFKMLLAGLLINQNMIPSALRWIQYISFYKYAYEALAVNDISSIQIVDTIEGVNVKLPAAIVLDKFGLVLDSYTRNVFVSCGLIVLLLLIIAALFQFKLREKR